MIIGLVGNLGSGKDSVAELLVAKGFLHISLSDIIRDEADKRGVERTRENLQDIGNDLRRAFGNDVLAVKAALQFEDNKHYVISSIRHPAEAEALKKLKPEFRMVKVDAPQKIRFQRIKKRARENDPKTLKAFIASEKKESRSKDTSSQQMDKVLAISDVTLRNDKTPKALQKKVEKMLGDLSRRPNWDEYFIEVMEAVAKRATCDRGRAGCVIAKNKQILVTGYVGSPVGLDHCDDVGHQMKSVDHGDGKVTQHCVRTAHAEQNAICQAAKLGVPIAGSTLYVRMTPCSTCAKMIINSGITRVLAQKKYHAGAESEAMFKKAGVQLEFLSTELLTYSKQ